MKSLSLFVGSSQCNAACAHCAGIIHRPSAPRVDGCIDEDLIRRVVRECYDKGARSLSISSSGEPTLSPISVTRVLAMVHAMCLRFDNINLYTNGIRIGTDPRFCEGYLREWVSMGLTRVYVTVHSINEVENARLYGIDYYPPLRTVVDRVHGLGLKMRANIVLSRRSIHTLPELQFTAGYLLGIGVDAVCAWPIRGADDALDTANAPPPEELDAMEAWASEMGPSIRLLREKDRSAYELNDKLTLFPDGTLSNKWCR